MLFWFNVTLAEFIFVFSFKPKKKKQKSERNIEPNDGRMKNQIKPGDMKNGVESRERKAHTNSPGHTGLWADGI